MAVRVLIAEDQRLLRQCFQEALGQDPEIEVVATAADGQEAVLLAEKLEPHVVLMDINMPHLDGMAATNLIRERIPTAKVLILSLHDNPDQVTKAIRAGVAGYISKDVDLEELIRIIKSIHRGERIHSPFLADQKLFAARETTRHGLSLREMQILRELAQGGNNSEIAEKLCLSDQTIKKELVGLFEKLGVKNRTQAAVRAVQFGLLDPDSKPT